MTKFLHVSPDDREGRAENEQTNEAMVVSKDETMTGTPLDHNDAQNDAGFDEQVKGTTHDDRLNEALQALQEAAFVAHFIRFPFILGFHCRAACRSAAGRCSMFDRRGSGELRVRVSVTLR